MSNSEKVWRCQLEYRSILSLIHNLYNHYQLCPNIKQIHQIGPQCFTHFSTGLFLLLMSSFFFFVLQIAYAIKSCCLAEIFMEKLTNMDKRTQWRNSTKHLDIQDNDNLLTTLKNPSKMLAWMDDHDKHHQL